MLYKDYGLHGNLRVSVQNENFAEKTFADKLFSYIVTLLLHVTENKNYEE